MNALRITGRGALVVGLLVGLVGAMGGTAVADHEAGAKETVTVPALGKVKLRVKVGPQELLNVKRTLLQQGSLTLSALAQVAQHAAEPSITPQVDSAECPTGVGFLITRAEGATDGRVTIGVAGSGSLEGIDAGGRQPFSIPSTGLDVEACIQPVG